MSLFRLDGGNAAVLLLVFLLNSSGCYSIDNPLIFSTSDCSLTEPVYGHKFDFGALHSFGHLAVSHKGDTFEYNICGNMTRACDGRQDVAACLKRDTKEYVLGTNHQLNYREGKMFFSFTNGSECPSGGHYQLHVFVGCDYTLDKNQSVVTGYADDACSFYVTLETPLACLPEPDAVKSNTCSVKDPRTGFKYDLMPLSDVNYRTSDHNGSAFVLNVCKPVLYGANAMCPAESSVCFIDLQSKNFKQKFFNYGTVQASPIFENDKLLMRHPSTTPCNATHNITSVIYFVCDRDAKTAEVKFLGNQGCNYVFVLTTPLVCSSLTPCTVISQRNEIYNMSSLQDKSFTLKMEEKNYTFAICGKVGEPCLENDGSCVIDHAGQSTSLGTADSHLHFNPSGSPYLLYEDGSPCQKSDAAAAATFWSTKIEFVCVSSRSATTITDMANKKSVNSSSVVRTLVMDGPKIIENSDCQLLIHYATELACRQDPATTCKAKVYVDHSEDGTGEEVVDLTPLISATENYVAQIDASITAEQLGPGTKFFINVCRPLVSKYGLGCPGGSAACMAKVGSSTPKDEKSLGFPLASLVARNRTNAELRYLRGDACPTDSSSQLSSGIEFYCDRRAGRGIPILNSISDCHYQFLWPTDVICPAHLCKFDAADCEIINDEINEHYSLRSAPYTDNGRIKLVEGSHQFTIIDVCRTEHKVWTDYAQGLVNLYFSAPGACGVDGNINVHMRLVCDPRSEGATTFSDDTQCNFVYTQQTPDICKFLGLNASAVAAEVTEATRTSTTTETPKTTIPTTSVIITPGSSHSDQDNVIVIASQQRSFVGGKNNLIEGIIILPKISYIFSERTHLLFFTFLDLVTLSVILSLIFLVTCLGLLAFSPARRNRLRRCMRRSSRSVHYSRVQSSEEANLLLEPNGHFTDSDDDMLL